MPRKPVQARSARVPWPGWATSRPCDELTLCGDTPGRRQAHHEGSTQRAPGARSDPWPPRGHASAATRGRAAPAAPAAAPQPTGAAPRREDKAGTPASWGESAHADLHQLTSSARMACKRLPERNKASPYGEALQQREGRSVASTGPRKRNETRQSRRQLHSSCRTAHPGLPPAWHARGRPGQDRTPASAHRLI